jgi:phage I-like protein
MLITALDRTLPNEGEPKSIVYIPEGIHTIRPTVGGSPETITVKMEPDQGEKIAAAFQAQLESMLNAGNVRATMDFDHKADGPASGLPQRFYYEKGKGLMLEVEWTGKGRKAIKGKDYSYFSPTFYKGDDGVPSGIPERGPLGSLVNSPAFRDIPRIAAADAGDAQNEPTENTMSKLIFAALAINASADTAEADAVQAIDKLKTDHESVKASLASAEQERDDLKAKVEAANKSRAESLVKAAVADGRIAPKDEDKQAKFRDKIEAGDTFAEEILAQLPKAFEGIDKDIITAGADKPANAGNRIEAAQAKARGELGASADFQLVWARAAEIDPTAFES